MGNDYYDIVIPPAEEPVTLAEAKAWCKVTHTAEDAIFTALLTAATQKAEKFTNRVFIERTFTGFFAGLECSKFEKGLYLALRRGPLLSVATVKVTVDDAQETASTDDYNVKQTSGFSRVIFSEFSESPDVIPYPWQVDFTAGYGAAADVPEPIKVAIKEAVCYWYSNRGDCAVGEELPGIAKGILSEYRIVNTYG